MFKIPARDQIWEIHTPQIMGILNATADSFYEGSRVKFIDLAIQKASQFIQEGANVLDFGGQSTRPGATFITTQDEIQNVIPIITAINSVYPDILLSIDTFKSEVALAAIKAGAHIVNDISCGGFDPKMFNVIADHNAGYIGMHITGSIENMHNVPIRENVVNSVIEYFEAKKKKLSSFGVHNWVIDPGFGFGKTIEENFSLVKDLRRLTILNQPILLGVSRKSSIYKTLNIAANDALNGTSVVNTIGLLNGALILRVHDVLEAKQITQLIPYLA